MAWKKCGQKLNLSYNSTLTTGKSAQMLGMKLISPGMCTEYNEYHLQTIDLCFSFTHLNISCHIKAMTTVQYILNEYILTLIGIKNTEALQEYLRGIRAKCGVKELNEEMEILFDKVSDSPSCFICIANSIGETWTHYGMREMWLQYYPQLRLHFDNWKECAQAGEPDSVKSYVFGYLHSNSRYFLVITLNEGKCIVFVYSYEFQMQRQRITRHIHNPE